MSGDARMFLDGRVEVRAGDCLDVTRTLADSSIDSVVTDPPYALVSIGKRYGNPDSKPSADVYGRATAGFMGKAWDTGDTAHTITFWREVYRVLKPGGHLLAFSGSRTYHRMVCAIEDAGFEVRDQIMWVYGSGFPKSHDVSKGIDRAAGAERAVTGAMGKCGLPTAAENYEGNDKWSGPRRDKAATDAARKWAGFGTALKPAHEPIVLARKPLSEKTVAANVLRWGTGAINVDGCRVGTATGDYASGGQNNTIAFRSSSTSAQPRTEQHAHGRWPANLIHSGEDEVVRAFPETHAAGTCSGREFTGWKSHGELQKKPIPNDSGSAARFFYSAKADSDDRLGSKHPTVKPVDLMQYLVRLVTPKNGTCLDPFAGTGTTAEACVREGMRCVLIEREPEYLADIERRCSLILAGPDARLHATIKAKGKVEDHGPLFGGGA